MLIRIGYFLIAYLGTMLLYIYGGYPIVSYLVCYGSCCALGLESIFGEIDLSIRSLLQLGSVLG